MKKKRYLAEERMEQEDKKSLKILTINLPIELYQLLLQKSGKGNIGNYIREAVEAKLKEEEIILTKAYRLLEDSLEYQEQTTLFQEIWEDKTYQETTQKNEKKSPANKKSKKTNG